jgi:hypothetical protein
MENNRGLTGPVDLLKQSIEITKQKAGVLYGITAINLVLWIPFFLIAGVSFLVGLAVNRSGGLLAGGLIALIVWIIFIFLSLRLQIALFAAIMNEFGFAQAFHASKGKIIRYFGTSFFSAIVIGLGFILLIIPGIICLVWYAFAPIIYLNEGISGWKALEKSKSYVSGRWWLVAWRLLFVVFVVWIVTFLVGIIGGRNTIGGIVGYLILFAMIPMIQVYNYLLYKNLKEIKEGVLEEAVPMSAPTPPMN